MKPILKLGSTLVGMKVTAITKSGVTLSNRVTLPLGAIEDLIVLSKSGKKNTHGQRRRKTRKRRSRSAS